MKLFSDWGRRWWQRTQLNSSIRKLRATQSRVSFSRSCEPLEVRQVLSASEPYLSEFLADNSTSIVDEDGDHSDWIEIRNPTTSSVSLNGWYLTDNRGNLSKWQFPNVSIPANGFLTVFASNKNRTNPSGTLHTNFKLDAGGEYLALVKPDRTVASEFTPNFPAQLQDVSYGIQTEKKFITEGTLGDFLVPTVSDAASLSTWKNSNFTVDTRWQSVPTGVGYGLANPGFNVRFIDVDGGGDGFIESTAEAENVLAGNFSNGAYNFASDIKTTTDTVDFAGGYGNFGVNHPYPNGVTDDRLEDIILQATATVTIPAGEWMIGFGSDDGGQLTLGNLNFVDEYNVTDAVGNNQIRFEYPRGHDWTVGHISVPAGGITTSLTSLFYERGGGDSFEIAIRSGTQQDNGIDTNVWQLLGNGVLGWSVNTADTSGQKTDVLSQMKGINPTSWLRIPFTVDDSSVLETLRLSMRYNDGFVAYLNGTEVARRNAPSSLSVNSAATAVRNGVISRVAENIDLSASRNLLVNGSNVLAIHGLNVSSGNSTFLIAPELIGAGLHIAPPQYFAHPTPGALNQDGYFGQVKDTKFSVDRGFFTDPINVAITSATSGATIRYTTDGSTPSETNGTVYSTPLTISQTTTLRARAFKPGFDASNVDTQTYLFLADVVNQSPNEETPPGFPEPGFNGQDLDYGMDPAIVNDPTYGPQLIEALKALPSISIVTDLPNLFSQTNGIYVNPYGSGIAWERPASVELINPDGSNGFQINAGLRIRGGFSRSGDNPKHALRLFFRDQYGDSKLNYPLFGKEDADSFDAVDLRTAQNYSWSFGGDPAYTFTRDIFSRDTQRDLGDPYTRGRYYHLYLDGQYWGLYQTQERSEADFAATYFGGKDDDYDVVKVEAGPYVINATDGNLDAWQRLWEKANAIAATPTQATRYSLYQELQGRNVDGTEDPNKEVLLDVDNLVDYMLVIFYGGNLDAPISAFLGNEAPNNWYGIRNRTTRDGFRFFAHDSEHTLLNANEDRTGPFNSGSAFERSNPQWIHQQLMFVDEYRLKFADRIQELFFHNGAFTPQVAAARMQQRANELSLPVIAESARWGDSKRPDSPLTKQDWLNQIDNINNYFFPQRTENLLQQLRVTQLYGGEGLAPLYPATVAPEFNQLGGQVAPGFDLRMAAPAGQIYYTTDGSDPRLPGGSVSPSAHLFDSTVSNTTVIARGASWKYLDNGSDQGTDWRGAAFDDGSWASGNAEFGYGDGDEATTVGYGSNVLDKYETTYFRKTFSVANPASIRQLTLTMKRDDGAVVYLNGQEVARSNIPDGDINYQTLASGPADETTYYEFNIDPALLTIGANVLAVEIHQVTTNSSDISFDADLIAKAFAGSSLPLNQSSLVQARVRDGSNWSALNAAQFFVNAAPSAANLAITELNYNPLPPTAAELTQNAAWTNASFEFIELQNIGNQTLDLPGVKFIDGVLFDFTDSPIATLAPGQRVVVVSDLAAFRARYGNGPQVAGTYTGTLSDNGELLALVDRDGGTIKSFTFDDGAGWPDRADGLGATLEVISTSGDFNAGSNWRASVEVGGTPATAGLGTLSSIVINEVLTHTDLPQVDSIELFNPTTSSIDIGGWYLSDVNGDYQKFRIPNGTIVPPLGFIVFDEGDFFTSGGTNPNDFRLDAAHGDNVWLVAADGNGKLTNFIDHVDFGAAINGESFGRWPAPDASSNLPSKFVPQASLTLGGPNSGPRVGPVIISEVMFAPQTPQTGMADDLEFIELTNPTNSAIDLTNWRITGGISFDFAASTMIPANGQLLVISFNPANVANADRLTAFRAAYGLNNSVPLVGGYSGQLSDSGETLKLLRPDDPPLGEPTFIPGITEDAVDYSAVAPWLNAVGNGRSLQRKGASLWGHDPASWSAATPTANSFVTSQTLVSLDGSGNLLVQDAVRGGLANTLTIDFLAAPNQISIRDTATTVSTSIPGAVITSANEVRIPRLSITGSRIVVQGGAGNDVVTVDLTGGLGGLLLEARGELGTDELILSGGATSITHQLSGTTSGFVQTNNSQVSYDGFGTVTDNAAATTKRYEVDVARVASDLTLQVAVDSALATRTAVSVVSLTSAPTVRFTKATNPLVIAGGNGNDSINVASVSSDYTGQLILLGGNGNDVLNTSSLAKQVSLDGGSGNDSLTAGNANLNQLVGGPGNDTLTGGSLFDQLTGGAGADVLNAGAGGGSLVEVFDGDMTLTATSLTTTISGVPTVDTLSNFSTASLTGGASANRIDATTFLAVVGQPVTLIGGGGADNITGSNGPDAITADSTVGVTVSGLSGNDTIITGSGNDSITGAAGTDSISSGAGNDQVFGGTGNDTINAGLGNDFVLGQDNDDSILGLDGDDSLQGGDGNDFMDGGVGNDRSFGGLGNDRLLGGNDNDSLFGDGGNDSLDGGAGNDQLRGSFGLDDIEGGLGTDRVSEDGDTDFTIIGLQISSTLFGTEVVRSIERFNLNGGPGNNKIDGRQAGAVLFLTGNDGNDTLLGGPMNDLINGGNGADVLSGGAGLDTIDGGLGTDYVTEKANADFTLSSSVAGLRVQSSITGDETIIGVERAAIIGGDSANRLDASAATIRVVLLGGRGNDTLLGGSLQDTLSGGARGIAPDGTDSLNGNASADTYDNDAADTRTVEAGIDSVVADVFASLPSWVDAL